MPGPVAGTKVSEDENEAIETVATKLKRTKSWVNRWLAVGAAVEVADALNEREVDDTDVAA